MLHKKTIAVRIAVFLMVAIFGTGAAIAQGPATVGPAVAERSMCC